MKLTKSFKIYLIEKVRKILLNLIQGIKLDYQFDAIFTSSNAPGYSVNNLSIYLKKNLKNNHKISHSKYYIFSSFLQNYLPKY